MSNVILIIDDDIDILDVLRDLNAYAGISSICKTGIISIDELIDLNPGLILLDHWLYDGYGSDFCKTVKANPQTSHIPIVMMTAVMDLELSDVAEADGLIRKPFDIDYLQDVIAHYIPGPR